MYYNRSALKRSTKQLIHRGVPAPFLVTLIYVLATTWVSTIANMAATNPLSTLAETMNSWTLTLSEMEYVSQGTLDAMTQQIWSALTGPQAMIGLLVALIISFYSMVVNLGYYGYTLKVMRGQEAGFGDLFSNFYMAGKIILLQVLKILFVYLWMLLFIFPGIVALYRYRMAEYCLLDDPDISALEAIRRSKKLMQGRKFDLFVTELSFIGWVLVEMLVFELFYNPVLAFTGSTVLANLLGLAAETVIAMFLVAYQNLTYAGFYLFVLGNQAPPVQNSSVDSNGTPQNPFEGGGNPWEIGDRGKDDEGWNQ